MITFFKVAKVKPQGEWGLDGCIHLQDWFLLYESDEPGLFKVNVVDNKTNELNAGWNTAWCVRSGVNVHFEGQVVFSNDLHDFSVKFDDRTKKWVGSIGPAGSPGTKSPHHNGTWHD